eukprot:scaffold19688_cov141-Isochrysis_galbana.AAC.4
MSYECPCDGKCKSKSGSGVRCPVPCASIVHQPQRLARYCYCAHLRRFIFHRRPSFGIRRVACAACACGVWAHATISLCAAATPPLPACPSLPPCHVPRRVPFALARVACRAAAVPTGAGRNRLACLCSTAPTAWPPASSNAKIWNVQSRCQLAGLAASNRSRG